MSSSTVNIGHRGQQWEWKSELNFANAPSFDYHLMTMFSVILLKTLQRRFYIHQINSSLPTVRTSERVFK